MDCRSLTEILFHEGLKIIEATVFMDYKKLERVEMPTRVDKVDSVCI